MTAAGRSAENLPARDAPGYWPPVRPLAFLALALAALSPAAPSAAQDCDDWSILVEEEPNRYVAGVWAGVPLTDAYAVERGVGGGLVRRVETGAHQADFTVEDVTRVVRARSACTTVDAIDIVVTEDEIFVVHVYGVDAGVFGVADVWRWRAGTRPARILGAIRRRSRDIAPAVARALQELTEDR